VLLHVATLLLALLAAKPGALPILEQPVFLWWKIFAHAYQLLFGNFFNVDCKVGNLDDIWVFDLVFGVTFVALFSWVVVNDTVRKV